MQPGFFDIKCDIPKLNGDNYKIWKESILLHLKWMYINYAIRKNEPHAMMATSTPAQVTLHDCWKRSNCLSIVFIKTKFLLEFVARLSNI